ncbi:hypothetical protein GCM10027590_63420 [Nocardiopsis nanhaiensis]
MRDQGVVDDQGFQNVLRVSWDNGTVDEGKGLPESNRAYHPYQGPPASLHRHFLRRGAAGCGTVRHGIAHGGAGDRPLMRTLGPIYGGRAAKAG